MRAVVPWVATHGYSRPSAPQMSKHRPTARVALGIARASAGVRGRAEAWQHYSSLCPLASELHLGFSLMLPREYVPPLGQVGFCFKLRPGPDKSWSAGTSLTCLPFADAHLAFASIIILRLLMQVARRADEWVVMQLGIAIAASKTVTPTIGRTTRSRLRPNHTLMAAHTNTSSIRTVSA